MPLGCPCSTAVIEEELQNSDKEMLEMLCKLMARAIHGSYVLIRWINNGLVSFCSEGFGRWWVLETVCCRCSQRKF